FCHNEGEIGYTSSEFYYICYARRISPQYSEERGNGDPYECRRSFHGSRIS
ncbi:unnamed protein product, partial [marine sediment metagenome]